MFQAVIFEHTTVPVGLSVAFPVTLPAPAPPGGVTVTLSSSDPRKTPGIGFPYAIRKRQSFPNTSGRLPEPVIVSGLCLSENKCFPTPLERFGKVRRNGDGRLLYTAKSGRLATRNFLGFGLTPPHRRPERRCPMSCSLLVGPLLQSFFSEHLVQHRQVSAQTLGSPHLAWAAGPRRPLFPCSLHRAGRDRRNRLSEQGSGLGILFQATAETLKTIAADPKHLGAEIGFFAVLHSWGQTSTGWFPAAALHPMTRAGSTVASPSFYLSKSSAACSARSSSSICGTLLSKTVPRVK